VITDRHIDALGATLTGLRGQSASLSRWGSVLAQRLPGGHRLLCEMFEAALCVTGEARQCAL
jgi:hypothetical protein